LPKKPAAPEATTLNTLDPILARFGKFVELMEPAKRKTYTIAILSVAVVISVVLVFIQLPRYIHVILGAPMGLLLFLLGFAFCHIRNEAHPEKIRWKEKYSPRQRIRISLVVIAIVIVVLVVSSSVIPAFTGGMLSEAVALGIYNFIRRTPEEIKIGESGEIDPRDLAAMANVNEDGEIEIDPTQQEIDEFADIVNSLSPEQQRILLNPKVYSGVKIVEADDKKKKRRLFRRQG
jgi:uncharacterized membrane protein YkgB